LPRPQKRFHTTNNPDSPSKQLKFPSEYPPLLHLGASGYSTSSSSSSGYSQDPRAKDRKIVVSDDYENNFNMGEYDDILEKFTRISDKIEEDLYTGLKGNFFKILATQNGSRILQKCLRKTSQDILSLLLDELKSRLHELMVDPYANYFCQKFFGFLSDKDKIVFLTFIKDNILFVANHKIGTYPLQIVIEQLRLPEERNLFIEAVKEKYQDMFYDAQGVHVIEKMLTCYSEDELDWLYDSILSQFMTLANNVNGLCLTKKIIVHAKKETTVRKIQQKLAENAITLVQNSYGNYSIQTTFENWDYSLTVPIIKQFFGKMCALSMQKFSSNVIEKCLERGGEVVLSKFINEVFTNNKIADLMKNNYGNYVVQKALKLANEVNRKLIIDMVLKNLERVGDKKLIMKWRFIVQSYISQNEVGNMYKCSSVPFKNMNSVQYNCIPKNI